MAKTVVIFGGSGFIGSYIVRRLSKLGYRIIIPTSNSNKAICTSGFSGLDIL